MSEGFIEQFPTVSESLEGVKMKFKWYLIKCKLEDHAYLPRMVSSVELNYALTEKTEDNNFVVKSQVSISYLDLQQLKVMLSLEKICHLKKL